MKWGRPLRLPAPADAYRPQTMKATTGAVLLLACAVGADGFGMTAGWATTQQSPPGSRSLGSGRVHSGAGSLGMIFGGGESEKRRKEVNRPPSSPSSPPPPPSSPFLHAPFLPTKTSTRVLTRAHAARCSATALSGSSRQTRRSTRWGSGRYSRSTRSSTRPRRGRQRQRQSPLGCGSQRRREATGCRI